MTDFSKELLSKLAATDVRPPESRPRILFAEDEVDGARDRARKTAGFLDRIKQDADSAADDEQVFGETHPEIPYFVQGTVKSLAVAAFLLEDEEFASRALEAVEVMFSWPAEEWVARPHRPMRCDHAMLNVASTIGIAQDLCAPFWGEEAVASVSQRINDYTVALFLETWEKQDAHWSSPDYHWNWKIMCCGEMGTAAISCFDHIQDSKHVMEACLAGCLDILDSVPPEGDWAEGAGYWLGTLAHGLKFGLGLQRATAGSVDMMDHPALRVTGDYLVHITEPDGMVYNFNDNGIALGASLDYLSLLAKRHRRGDWARTARASDHVSLERLVWDDPTLTDEEPSETSRSFPGTGVVMMRSGWDSDATFVGLKSGDSTVGHAQHDANSFVVSAGGERLLIDEGIWPYGHDLGFFDRDDGRRWNFDANGSIGHSTLIVDGEEQMYGEEFRGRIAHFEAGDELDVAVADATKSYGGKLTRYLRTLAFLKPNLLLVYDEVACDKPRHLEWHFHHRGDVSGNEDSTTIVTNGQCLTLRRMIPEEVECWRTSDVNRQSVYTESNQHQRKRVEVRYRSFGPFHHCEEIDVLWAIHVGGDPDPDLDVNLTESECSVGIRFHDGVTRQVEIPRKAYS